MRSLIPLLVGSMSTNSERNWLGSTPSHWCQGWLEPSRSGSLSVLTENGCNTAPGRFSKLTLNAGVCSSSWDWPSLPVPTTPPPMQPSQCLAFRVVCSRGRSRGRSLAKWLETNTRPRSATALPSWELTSLTAASREVCPDRAVRQRAWACGERNQRNGENGPMAGPYQP